MTGIYFDRIMILQLTIFQFFPLLHRYRRGYGNTGYGVQRRVTKFERFWAKNQFWSNENFEVLELAYSSKFSKIGHHFGK